MRPDPDRVRLAAEALARARADAWARGERPQVAAGTRQSSDLYSERAQPTVENPFSPSWSARPRREDPQPFSAALGGLLSARGWRQQAGIGAVFSRWPEIVGPELAAHTKPESFDDGQLTVLADSDTWATQVRLLAPQLLKRLAEELGAGTIRRLRVRGPAAARPSGRLRSRRPSP